MPSKINLSISDACLISSLGFVVVVVFGVLSIFCPG